jgi:hypothetical protein
MSFYFWYVSFDIDMGIFVLGDCGALNIRHIDRTVLPRISWLAGGEYAVHHTYVGRLVPEAERLSRAIQIRNHPSFASNPSRFPYSKSLTFGSAEEIIAGGSGFMRCPWEFSRAMDGSVRFHRGPCF